jgi:hypothetical protein
MRNPYMEKTARGKKSKYFILISEYSTFSIYVLMAWNSYLNIGIGKEKYLQLGKIRVNP